MKIKITEKSKKDLSTFCLLQTPSKQSVFIKYATNMFNKGTTIIYAPYIPILKNTEWVPF